MSVIAVEEPSVGVSASLLLALATVVVLAVLHVLAPHIRRLPMVPEHATASFAGGLAVSYVFLHLLPEIARGSRHVTAVLGDRFTPSPLVELAIFAVALVGFLLFYGLERLAVRTAAHRDGGGRDEGAPIRGVFAVHVGSFMLYNAVIAYTLATTWRTGATFAALFSVAIGLHFVLTDRSLEEHYGSLFDRRGPRLALAGALGVGWALSVVFAPTRTVVVSVLTAFVAGGVLLNVFKEEIPSTRRSHFGWFTVGLVLYAGLLGAVTAMDVEPSSEDPGEGAVAGAGR